MSRSERPQSDANRIAIDNLPPSLRPRRWVRSRTDTTPQLAQWALDPEPDPLLDDIIEAAGEQPAP